MSEDLELVRSGGGVFRDLGHKGADVEGSAGRDAR
jgi:hypothetical protein